MLKIVNWVKMLNPAYRSGIQAFADQSMHQLTSIYTNISSGAESLHQRLASELRFKAALVSIDTKLASLADASSAARAAGNIDEMTKINARIALWNNRKLSCERTLNRVRLKINAVRNSWAVWEAEAKQVTLRIYNSLKGFSADWATTLHKQCRQIVTQIGANRRQVADLMTKSALIHNGRTLQVQPSDFLRRLDRLGAQIAG